MNRMVKQRVNIYSLTNRIARQSDSCSCDNLFVTLVVEGDEP